MSDLESLIKAGRKFLGACNSAWAAGEPPHKVRAMLDEADAFAAALEAAEIASWPPHVQAGYRATMAMRDRVKPDADGLVPVREGE